MTPVRCSSVGGAVHQLHDRAMRACDRMLAARATGDTAKELRAARQAMNLEQRAYDRAIAAGVSPQTETILKGSLDAITRDWQRLARIPKCEYTRVVVRRRLRVSK